MRSKSLFPLGALLLTLAGGVDPADAATASTSFSVTAQVVTQCFVTATNMNFGAYSGIQLDATSTVSATCTTGTPYYIGLHEGRAPGATTSTRKMTGPGGQLLAYSTYRNPARTLNWGKIVPRDAQFGVGSINFTAYGRIPAGQFVQSGAYSDTILVELTF